MPPMLKPGERVKGHIPAVDVKQWPSSVKGLETDGDVEDVKLIPWQESVLRGTPDPVPAGQVRKLSLRSKVEDISQSEHAFDTLQEGLPAPVRRTSHQRYESLVQKLMAAARSVRTPTGLVIWPTSIQLVLDSIGVKNTQTTEEQVYALARYYIVRAENQQRRKDAKKVTNDWHGHYD